MKKYLMCSELLINYNMTSVRSNQKVKMRDGVLWTYET